MATSERTLRLLDINVMIALSLANHVHHKAATSWFEDIDAWATCSITESAYCRLLLNPRVTGFELGVSEVVFYRASLPRGIETIDELIKNLRAQKSEVESFTAVRIRRQIGRASCRERV